MNIQQLTRLGEVGESAIENAQTLLDTLPENLRRGVYEREIAAATAALADVDAEIAKLKKPFADMTWEEFAKISYEAATQHHNDRVTHDGFKISTVEFYELSRDKIEAWTHGCAVALAAYKKLTPQAREPMSEEEIDALYEDLYQKTQGAYYRKDVIRAFEAHHKIGVEK